MLPRVLVIQWIFNINDISNTAKEEVKVKEKNLGEISIHKIEQKVKYNYKTTKWFCSYIMFPEIIQPRHFTKKEIYKG
jgi:hypothetical protein